MESQKKLVGRVNQISAVFGVCFSFKLKSPEWIVKVIVVQMVFAAFTSYFFNHSFRGFTNPMHLALMGLQCVVPLIIEILINIEAFRKRKNEDKIVKTFETLQMTLVEDFGCTEVKGSNTIFWSFVVKIFVLIVVRMLKVFIADFFYSLNAMMTELVCSVSDFAFIFYIDLLKIYVRQYASSITSENIATLDVRRHFLTFYKMTRMITGRFSLSLFMNIAFTFVTLITSFYWVFIRIIYGPLK